MCVRIFPSICFSLSGFKLTYFKFIVLSNGRCGSIFIFLRMDMDIFPAPLVEQAVFFPVYVFDTFVKLKWPQRYGFTPDTAIYSTAMHICLYPSNMLWESFIFLLFMVGLVIIQLILPACCYYIGSKLTFLRH